VQEIYLDATRKKYDLKIENVTTFDEMPYRVAEDLITKVFMTIKVECNCHQCCGSELNFFIFGFQFGFEFYRSGKGNINFLRYRQSVLHEDVPVLIKLKFLPP
jgi:hypothetical protein